MKPKYQALLSLAVLTLLLCANPVSAQKSFDWSSLVPEIAGCERIVGPRVERDGEIIEQTAVYKRRGYRQRLDQYPQADNLDCGTITLRIEPAALKNARAAQANNVLRLPVAQFKIEGFDAFRESPQCGVDPWLGRTRVYFDHDKVLIANAYRGAEQILEYALAADYRILKNELGRLRKGHSRR